MILLSRPRFSIAAGIVSLAFWASECPGQAACRVAVPETVAIDGAALSLADLLAPDTCPELLRVASHVPLGSAPLAGSVRVIEGQFVRNLVEGLALRRGLEPSHWSSLQVPERVSVRRSGQRASCMEIGARILGVSAASRLSAAEADSIAKTDGTAAVVRADDCGAAGRVFREARMEVMEARWDRTLRSRIVRARCARPNDCVPFVIRVRDVAEPHVVPAVSSAASSQRAVAKPTGDLATRADQSTLVRSGQTVTLLWNQGGISLVAPAVCLDKGAKGDSVRARIANGGSVVRAVVEGEGSVRVSY